MYKIEKQNVLKKDFLQNSATSVKYQEIYQVDAKISSEEDTHDYESLDKSLELKSKSLAQLHKIKIEQEKEAVANKLKEHYISGPQKVNYELPGFLKKQSSK